MFHVKHSCLAMLLTLVGMWPAFATARLGISLDCFVDANHEVLFAA